MSWNVYKPGQGYYTRLGSAVAFGLVGAGLAVHVYNKLGGFAWFHENGIARLILPLLIAAAAGYAIYRFCYLDPRPVEFLIATEGEMKKVTWSSRKEVIGATQVVIGLMVVMSLFIFAVDFLVSQFFSLSWIGVINTGRG
jgi:preprotein translocase subunit SecE